MPLKHWQAWDTEHLSRKLIPGFDNPFSKEMFPNVWHSFEPFPVVQSLDTRQNSAPPSPCPLLRKLQRAMRSPLSLLFLKLDKLISCSSQDMPSRPSTSFAALLWKHSSALTPFLNCGAQNCTQCSRWGRINSKYSGIVTSLGQQKKIYRDTYVSQFSSATILNLSNMVHISHLLLSRISHTEGRHNEKLYMQL